MEDPSATIIGGMTLHRMKVSVQHFGELSGRIVFMALHEGYNSRRIELYWTTIKRHILKQRKELDVEKITTIYLEKYQVDKKIHRWDKIITRQKCKVCVIKFPSNHWVDKSNRQTFWRTLITLANTKKILFKNNSKRSQILERYCVVNMI